MFASERTAVIVAAEEIGSVIGEADQRPCTPSK
jgi:hypothetical protein